jgi:hypothetical protein
VARHPLNSSQPGEAKEAQRMQQPMSGAPSAACWCMLQLRPVRKARKSKYRACGNCVIGQRTAADTAAKPSLLQEHVSKE